MNIEIIRNGRVVNNMIAPVAHCEHSVMLYRGAAIAADKRNAPDFSERRMDRAEEKRYRMEGREMRIRAHMRFINGDRAKTARTLQQPRYKNRDRESVRFI